MNVCAACCSRSSSLERCEAVLSWCWTLVRRCSRSLLFALSMRPRSEMPTPTRMPMIRARKTAASEATWYRRSNISELRGSLAQRVQAIQRRAGQGAAQADEERAADGELDLGSRRLTRGEPELRVEALPGHVPADTLERVDRENDERSGHIGPAQERRPRSAVQAPAGAGGQPAPVWLDPRNAGPPVREVERLGEEPPDVLAGGEELTRGGDGGHRA